MKTTKYNFKKIMLEKEDPWNVSQANINIANEKGGHEHAWLDSHLDKLDDVDIESSGGHGDSEEFLQGAQVTIDGKYRQLTDDELDYIADNHSDWVYNHYWDNYY